MTENMNCGTCGASATEVDTVTPGGPVIFHQSWCGDKKCIAELEAAYTQIHQDINRLSHFVLSENSCPQALAEAIQEGQYDEPSEVGAELVARAQRAEAAEAERDRLRKNVTRIVNGIPEMLVGGGAEKNYFHVQENPALKIIADELMDALADQEPRNESGLVLENFDGLGSK